MPYGIDIVEATVRLSVDPKGTIQGTQLINTHITRTIDKTKKAVDQFGYMYLAIKRIATYTLIFSFFAGFVRILGQIVELQKRQAEVQTLVDMRNKQAAASYRGVMDAIMHLPPHLGSAIELTKGLYEIMSAGITKPKEAFDVLVASAKYAKAGLTDLATAASSVTAIMKAYSLESTKAREVTDMLFASVMEGKFHADDLNDALGKVIPTAATMGISIDEVVTALAVLTQRGLDVHEAATGLNRIFLAWMKPMDKTQKAFHKLGLEWGRNAFSAKSFGETLQIISDASERYGDLLPQIFTRQRGLKSSFILTGSGLKDYFELLQRVRGATEGYGEVSRAAEKIQLTLSDTIKASRNAILQAAASWGNWTTAAKKGVTVGKDFIVAVMHAPTYILAMAAAHKFYTGLIVAQNAAMLQEGRFLTASAGWGRRKLIQQKANIAASKENILVQEKGLKKLKMYRVGLLLVLTALLLVNEAIVRWSKAMERSMALMVANARHWSNLRKEANALDAILKDLGETANETTIAVGEKIASGYVLAKLRKLKESGYDVRNAYVEMNKEMTKINKTTDFHMEKIHNLVPEIQALIKEFYETGTVGDENRMMLRLLARGYNLYTKSLEEAIAGQKRRKDVSESLYESERQISLVMRDLPDILSDATKHWAILSEQFDVDKLKSMKRTIETILDPQFEGKNAFLRGLEKRGYGIEQYRDQLVKAMDEINIAIKKGEDKAYGQFVTEWVRTLTRGFTKFKLAGQGLDQFAMAMQMSWHMFMQEGIKDTKIFVQSIGESGKRLIVNWKNLSSAQQAALKPVYDLLMKSATKESKAREKALNDVTDWGTEYQKILNDVAQFENILMDKKHDNILIKAQEEIMIKKNQLQEEWEALLKYHGFSFDAWVQYAALLGALRKKEHMARQVAAKQWMDTENKTRHEILRKDYEFVWQRLAGAKRYYREQEAAIINLEGIDKETRAKMLLDNQTFWERLIEEYQKADTALGRWVSGLKLAARMLGSLIQVLQSFIAEMGWQDTMVARVVGAFTYLAQGIRASATALEAYQKASEVAGSASATFIDKLLKTASVVDLVIVGLTTVIGFIAKLFGGKSEQEKAAEAAERAQKALEAAVKATTLALAKFGEVSESTAKKIYELTQKGIQGFVAVSMLLNDVMRDTGINMKNFELYSARIIDVLEHMEQGFIDSEEAIKVFGDAFQQMIDYAKKFGLEGSRAILDMIRKVRELGIVVPEVAAYIKEQLESAAQGLIAMIQWVAADAVEAMNVMKELTKEEKQLLRQIEKLKKRMEGLAVGSDRWNELNDQLKEYQERLAEIDKEYLKHQKVIGKYGEATKRQLRDLGIIAASVFNSMVAEGIPLTEILNTMSESIFALMDRYKALGMEVPDYLKPIFRVFRAFRGHEEIFKGLDGLTQVMMALGNSAYLTEDAFKALMREARRYYNMMTREKSKGGMGLPDKDAIRMLYPLLQQAWWYAEQYNMKLPKWMDDMIARAKKMGFKFEAPMENQQLDALKDIFKRQERNRVSIREKLEEVKKAINRLGGNYQHGTTGLSNTQFARVHQGEAILPSNVSQALREFFTGSRGDLFGGGGGRGVAQVTVNIDGRAVYKAIVPMIREGGAYGDFEVEGQSVF